MIPALRALSMSAICGHFFVHILHTEMHLIEPKNPV